MIRARKHPEDPDDTFQQRHACNISQCAFTEWHYVQTSQDETLCVDPSLVSLFQEQASSHFLPGLPACPTAVQALVQVLARLVPEPRALTPSMSKERDQRVASGLLHIRMCRFWLFCFDNIHSEYGCWMWQKHYILYTYRSGETSF